MLGARARCAASPVAALPRTTSGFLVSLDPAVGQKRGFFAFVIVSSVESTIDVRLRDPQENGSASCDRVVSSRLSDGDGAPGRPA